MMKCRAILFLMLLAVLSLVVNSPVKEALAQGSGEELFVKNCSQCHPDGGNIFNKQKTLRGKDLEANNIRTAEDIVKLVRNPGPAPTHPSTWSGMKKFDERELPTEDALRIGEYILKTFR